MSEKIETRLTIDDSNNALKASLILAEHTGLSQAKIKDAMHKGAVWLAMCWSLTTTPNFSSKLCRNRSWFTMRNTIVSGLNPMGFTAKEAVGAILPDQ